MSLRIVRMAAGSALQDRGRPGWRRYGVPPAGAFDRESYTLALALVGEVSGAVLEIPMMGGEFAAEAEVRVAVVGAVGEIRIDGEPALWQSAFRLTVGQRMVLAPPTRGARSYLAVAGGWRGQEVLGSLSNQPPESLTSHPSHAAGTVRLEMEPDSLRPRTLRVFSAAHCQAGDAEALSTSSFCLGLDSNRMGIRLKGGQFEAAEEIPSEPTCFGAIQLTPSNELIVHGPDGPTVGGYPKIAYVAEPDLDRLAQLRPAEEVRFEWVTREVALAEAGAWRARIERTAQKIRVAAG